MDWKYALSLELRDPGFNFTVLHDFRERLVLHQGAPQLLLRDRGQRLDTHPLKGRLP